MTSRLITGAAILLLAPPATAIGQQHSGGGRPGALATAPPREASQYDFLVGQWELTVRVPAQGLAQRIHGTPRLIGTWKAWRAMDGWGIEDEMRITDAAGNPMALTHSLRVYDATARRWNLTTVDAYRGRVTAATAEWRGAEMILSGSGTDPEGRAYVTRTRIHGISANAFRFQQDRSTDGGRTWEEGTLRIEARKVAEVAPR